MSRRQLVKELMATDTLPTDVFELARVIDGEKITPAKEGAFIEPTASYSSPVTNLLDQPFGLNAVKNLEAEHYSRPMFDMQDFCFGGLGKTQEWLEACVCRR